MHALNVAETCAVEVTICGMNDIEKRLTDLEVKASFNEDLVDHLNALVTRQQQQIELLMREVGKLKERAPDTSSAEERDPRADVPPHY